MWEQLVIQLAQVDQPCTRAESLTRNSSVVVGGRKYLIGAVSSTDLNTSEGKARFVQ